jgi:hypothetical protein
VKGGAIPQKPWVQGHLIKISELKRFPIYLGMQAIDLNVQYLKIYISASCKSILKII